MGALHVARSGACAAASAGRVVAAPLFSSPTVICAHPQAVADGCFHCLHLQTAPSEQDQILYQRAFTHQHARVEGCAGRSWAIGHLVTKYSADLIRLSAMVSALWGLQGFRGAVWLRRCHAVWAGAPG